MRAELARIRRGVPRPMELYSVFYISVCCQKLPQLAAIDVPTTSSPTPSLLTSPKSAGDLEAENQRLKLHLQTAQTQVTEAREKMLENSEAFLASQTDHVRNLYQLAPAMKEKMDNLAAMEKQ